MNVEALESGAPGPGSEAIKPIRATIRERTPGCQEVGGCRTDSRGPGHHFGFENLRHLWELPMGGASMRSVYIY